MKQMCKMDRELDDLRSKIDQIDIKILSMIAARLSVVDEIIQVKQQNGFCVEDMKREKELITKLESESQKLRLPKNIVANVWNPIIRQSKEHQFQKTGERK